MSLPDHDRQGPLTGFRLQPAADTQWLSETVLVGGSPLVIVQLSTAAAQAARRLLAGTPVDPGGRGEGALTAEVARRLLDAGLALPELGSAGPTWDLADLAVVIPALNARPTLPKLLSTLPAGLAEVIVVDDGSVDGTGEVARSYGARVLHNSVPQGPAAARNKGLRAVSASAVLLIDADAYLAPGALATLLGHLADPAVAMVAPRISAVDDKATESGSTSQSVWPTGRLRRWVVGHEAARSPFDLGAVPGRVARGGQIPFLPSCALLVSRAPLVEAGGFDEGLLFGEDVDLSWRLRARGHLLRYEPAAIVYHHHRAEPWDALRRRFHYGAADGPLGRRHRETVAALTADPGPLLALLGGSVLGPFALAGLGGISVSVATARLVVAGVPVVPAAKLTTADHIRQLRTGLFCLTRPWLPVALAASLGSRRARRILVFSLLARHLADWRRRRPDLGPLPWTVARVADDASYAAGLWWSMFASRTLAPLAVRLRPRPDATAEDWVELARLG